MLENIGTGKFTVELMQRVWPMVENLYETGLLSQYYQNQTVVDIGIPAGADYGVGQVGQGLNQYLGLDWDWDEVYQTTGPKTTEYFENQFAEQQQQQLSASQWDAAYPGQARYAADQQTKQQFAQAYDPIRDKNAAITNQLNSLRQRGALDENLQNALDQARALGMDTSKYTQQILGTYDIAGSRNVNLYAVPDGIPDEGLQRALDQARTFGPEQFKQRGIAGVGGGVTYEKEQQYLASLIQKDITALRNQQAGFQGKIYSEFLPEDFASYKQQLQREDMIAGGVAAEESAEFKLVDAGLDPGDARFDSAAFDRDPFEAFYRMVQKNPAYLKRISEQKKEKVVEDPYYGTYLQSGQLGRQSYEDYLSANPVMAAQRETRQEEKRKQDLSDRLYGRRRIATPTRWL